MEVVLEQGKQAGDEVSGRGCCVEPTEVLTVVNF